MDVAADFPFCHRGLRSYCDRNPNTLDLAPVVQRVDIRTVHWIAQLTLIALICWIVSYLVDSAIQSFNNWGLGPVSRKSRKAIRKTPTRLFCKAGLFVCKENKN